MPFFSSFYGETRFLLDLQQVTTENTAESQTLMTLRELEISKMTFKKKLHFIIVNSTSKRVFGLYLVP